MSSFQKEGNLLYLLGETKSEFGGSLYMKELHGKVAGKLPEIDYDKELSLWNTVINANKKGLLSSAKDCSSGGLALVIAKMAAVSSLGAQVEMMTNNTNEIFSETFSRAVVEVSPENAQAFESMVDGISFEKIGTVGGKTVVINDVRMELSELKAFYFDTFKKVVEQDI